MRRTPIAPMSSKRRAALAANGIAHPEARLESRIRATDWVRFEEACA